MSEPSPDYSQISGFYGPGAWAAWVILLVSSWIPIYLNNYESNTHFIASALYTNWAAIDLLRHVRRSGHHEYFEPGNPLEHVIDAAGAVIFIGTTHSLLQGIVCVFKFSSVAAGAKRKLQKRNLIIHLGLLLPLPVSCYGCLATLPPYPAFIITLVPFYYTVLLLSEVVKSKPPFLVRMFPPQKYRNAPLWVSLVVVLLAFYFRFGNVLSFGTLIYDDERTEPSIGSLLVDRCHYIPCAPQKINEWDQVFSLLVALALFFYEFKTHILFLLGRLWDALGEWYTRKFQSSF